MVMFQENLENIQGNMECVFLGTLCLDTIFCKSNGLGTIDGATVINSSGCIDYYCVSNAKRIPQNIIHQMTNVHIVKALKNDLSYIPIDSLQIHFSSPFYVRSFQIRI